MNSEPLPVEPGAARLFADSALRRNPAWVQMLGLCPLLAVTTTLDNAVAMAAASAIVLIGSSVVVAALARWIPDDIRLPCFVVIIATFTTAVTMLMRAWAFELYDEIALFVQIIVTNCMILGRIEQVASKQPIGHAVIDATGAAVGFAVALIVLGGSRELLSTAGFTLAAMPPGAFIIAGLLLAVSRMLKRESGQAPADI